MSNAQIEITALRAILRELLVESPDVARRLIKIYNEDSEPKPEHVEGIPPDFLQMVPGLTFQRIRELAQQSLDPECASKPETF